MPRFRPFELLPPELETIHDGHHEIQEDGTRPFGIERAQRLQAVSCSANGIALHLEQGRAHRPRVVILHDENLGHPVDVSDDAAIPSLVTRLERGVDEFNQQHLEKLPLSLSIGVGRYDPESCRTVEDLLAAADAGLYDAKRRRRLTRS